jgi:predicted deacetylase
MTWERCDLADNAKDHKGDSGMVPRPAQYLLRFDDLCPTVSYKRWQRFLPLIEEFGIRPILAVVPDNRDYRLQYSPVDPEFWDRMRALEAAGAMIALHGYRHLCQSWGKSLLQLHYRSEFAGVDEDRQQEWIHEGLGLLRGHGLNPRVWVAPRHGFDAATLRALKKEGIGVLSDGFARIPFTRGGLTWIPQQLWEPVEKSKGIWTICVHANTARASSIEELRAFLRRHAEQFTSVDRVLAEFQPAKLDGIERAYETYALWRAQASHITKRLLHRYRNPGSR